MPLITGLAVARAVSETAGVHAGVKWPNDVLVEEDEWRKVCGVLCEVQPAGVVVGFGVNVDQTRERLPPSRRRPRCASRRGAGASRGPHRLLPRAPARSARRPPRRRGAAKPSTRHTALPAGPSGWSSTSTGEQTQQVRALSVDDEGRLLVHGEGGEYAVAAGDVVHVRSVVPVAQGAAAEVLEPLLAGCSRCRSGPVRTIPGKHGMISGVGGRPHARRRSARGGVGGAQDDRRQRRCAHPRTRRPPPTDNIEARLLGRPPPWGGARSAAGRASRC